MQNCTWSMPLPEPRFAGIPPRSVFSNEPADTTWMQQVAAEMKHSETAFLNPVSGGWNLRWFTPQQEVELCGHATLACAFVLWESGKGQSGLPITFETLSGTLTARKEGEWITLDFPGRTRHGTRTCARAEHGSGSGAGLYRSEQV